MELRFKEPNCNSIPYTVEWRVLTHVYIIEIKFFPNGHSKQISNFPSIDNLKKAACASKQNVLVLANLW